MLTARNVIFGIVAVALLSVVMALFSLFWNGESHSPLGKNSYGTRTEGYRAIHDVLMALDYETERVLIPTADKEILDSSYILWNPRKSLVQTEPSYLKLLSEWVRDGGRLVVAPAAGEYEFEMNSAKRSSLIPVSLLNELGLSGVSIVDVDLADREDYDQWQEVDEIDKDEDGVDFEDVRGVFQVKKRPTAKYSIAAEGEWEFLNAQASRVTLPSDDAWEVDCGEQEPLARITIENTGENTEAEPTTLAALFSLGKGQIIVVSNPFLAGNAYLADGDNSVVLVHLLTGNRPRVLFDEFYHGLTIRGNAMWLLSKLPYAIMVVSVLAVVGLWTWREAIFLGPSRQDRPVSRRSLGEYIEAMSRFVLSGRGGAKHVLQEVRQGVLWHYCKTLGLPPQQQDAVKVLGVLTRRQPEKAKQLEAALKYADAVLDNPRAPKDKILQATRKVSDCLST